MPALAILTRDLRITDNPVLDAGDTEVIPMFVADPTVENLHGSPNRQAFLGETLTELATDVADDGGRLLVRRGPWVETVLRTATEAGVSEIRVARDASTTAQRRVRELRSHAACTVTVVESIPIVSPDRALPAGGDHAKVFTPYYRRWLAAPRRAAAIPGRLADHRLEGGPVVGPLGGPTSPDRQLGGESAARRRLEAWLARATAYDESRDLVFVDGTSRLSADLHFGTISPREVEERAMASGADGYVRQLAWRDFNFQLLFHRPDVSHTDYRGVDRVWINDPESLDAWKHGRTGFPLVDAAMRQLTQTGWMHNRARMVTASFLTKDLMIDWRLGARWFMTWLADGDVANNQLGWQWVAGTGTDANPTRIFNPTRQSERFDPNGRYIRRWVPELSDVADDEIHDPGPLTRVRTGYPLPLVDHHQAIRDYKTARGFR